MEETTSRATPNDGLRTAAVVHVTVTSIWLILSTCGFITLFFGATRSISFTILPLILYNFVALYGAICMLRRTSYLWAFASCGMAIAPFYSPFYLVGIPIGLWGISKLRKPHVRDSFEYM